MIKVWIDIDKAREKIYDMVEKYKKDNPVKTTFDNTWNTAFELGASNATLALFDLLNDESCFKLHFITEESEDDR